MTAAPRCVAYHHAAKNTQRPATRGQHFPRAKKRAFCPSRRSQGFARPLGGMAFFLPQKKATLDGLGARAGTLFLPRRDVPFFVRGAGGRGDRADASGRGWLVAACVQSQRYALPLPARRLTNKTRRSPRIEKSRNVSSEPMAAESEDPLGLRRRARLAK
jgi:hypothetical protein